MEGYRGLKVYEKSFELSVSIYEFTKGMPSEERYELSSQLRRAATGIPLNIAEGYARKESVQTWKHFLSIAMGSCEEMKVLLDIIKRLGYIGEEKYGRYREGYEEISRMIYGLKNKLQ